MYKEINELYLGFKNGSKSSLEKLLIKLKPMIISSIYKYYRNFNEFEDLIQEGYILIIKKLYEFDETKGNHLLGYLKVNLKYYYLNKNKQSRSFLSLNEKTEEETEIIDLIQNGEKDVLDEIILKEDLKKLYTSIFNLTDRQKDVVLMYYLENKTMYEISEILGISYRTVVNTKTIAIEKLKSKF